jgi:hypothetical protein
MRCRHLQSHSVAWTNGDILDKETAGRHYGTLHRRLSSLGGDRGASVPRMRDAPANAYRPMRVACVRKREIDFHGRCRTVRHRNHEVALREVHSVRGDRSRPDRVLGRRFVVDIAGERDPARRGIDGKRAAGIARQRERDGAALLQFRRKHGNAYASAGLRVFCHGICRSISVDKRTERLRSGLSGTAAASRKLEAYGDRNQSNLWAHGAVSLLMRAEYASGASFVR